MYAFSKLVESRITIMAVIIPKEKIDGQTHFSFLLIEEFSALSVIAAIEVLSAANQLLGFGAYRWNFLSHDGKDVLSSTGMRFEVKGDLMQDMPMDYLFVCARDVHDPPYRQRLNARLKHLDRMGVKLGALTVGTFILARAGLLDGHKCTLHWELEPAFREEFPEIEYRPALYVIDRHRHTASGGIASMELMLRLIEEEYGEEICQEIANLLHLDRIRDEHEIQRSGSIAHLGSMPAQVQSAVRLMLENMEVPLTNQEIAGRIHTSVRNLERLFMRHLGFSPAKYYLTLRLEKARELLLHTNMSALEVALQTGFSSSSYFARCFRREFGKRPSDLRHERERPRVRV